MLSVAVFSMPGARDWRVNVIDLDDQFIRYSVSTITTSLLQGARDGRQEAWDRLVFLYGPLVYKWCRKRGLSRDDARDISQDVFEIVARKLPEFQRDRVGDTFRGWLRSIANFKILDQWRKTYSRLDSVSISHLQETVEQIPLEGISDDEESAVDDRLDIFERVLDYGRDTVNADHWEVFWRVVVDEENRHDVATRFDMKRANVDLIVSRVLAKLREAFGDVFESRETPQSTGRGNFVMQKDGKDSKNNSLGLS